MLFSFSSTLSHCPLFKLSPLLILLFPSPTLDFTLLTTGLAHNFAGSASTLGYSSVMDYPSALVHLDENGELALEIVQYWTV
jgi:hypothetical protein